MLVCVATLSTYYILTMFMENEWPALTCEQHEQHELSHDKGKNRTNPVLLAQIILCGGDAEK